MIPPQTSALRLAIALEDWLGRADPEDRGETLGWTAGIPDARPVAVPGSWNAQLAPAGLEHHAGAFWYQRDIELPAWDGDFVLHFGGACHHASVWLDGEPAGTSSAPMLPFAIPVSAPRPGRRLRAVVRVDSRFAPDGEMMGITRADYVAEGRPKDEYHPPVRFDFLPHGGLCEPVHLCLLPRARLESVRVASRLVPNGAIVEIASRATGLARVRARIGTVVVEVPPGEPLACALPGARLWSPGDPFLHELTLEGLDAAGRVVDSLRLPVGVREVRVEGRALLLNGQPLRLTGFGRHQEMPVSGRAVPPAALVRDAACLAWVGANSVRNAHYPHGEAWLDLCDRLGILVISEAFSVNLDFRRVTDATLAGHCRAVEQLIARDGNHACVIAWSLANEPGYLGEADYRGSGAYWQTLFAHARRCDPGRPLLHANVQAAGLDDPAFDHADILALNRYHGWYQMPGDPGRAAAALADELDWLAARHDKPIFLSEFGADAIAGAHGFGSGLFTEEYQAELVERLWQVISAHPAVIGGHVWVFADFATAEHSRRAVGNRKGAFTADRSPKLLAHKLRALWRG